MVKHRWFQSYLYFSIDKLNITSSKLNVKKSKHAYLKYVSKCYKCVRMTVQRIVAHTLSENSLENRYSSRCNLIKYVYCLIYKMANIYPYIKSYYSLSSLFTNEGRSQFSWTLKQWFTY